jgi:hypothetical protein
MESYANNEQQLIAVSLIVVALGTVAIISSPFILNSPPVFYICVILTIIAGLYLSRNIAYKESTPQNERKRTKARRPKRRRR